MCHLWEQDTVHGDTAEVSSVAAARTCVTGGQTLWFAKAPSPQQLRGNPWPRHWEPGIWGDTSQSQCPQLQGRLLSQAGGQEREHGSLGHPVSGAGRVPIQRGLGQRARGGWRARSPGVRRLWLLQQWENKSPAPLRLVSPRGHESQEVF